MGVLGWTPQTTWRDATLNDIALAVSAFLLAREKLPATEKPNRTALEEMMRKFPDAKKEKKDDDDIRRSGRP